MNCIDFDQICKYHSFPQILGAKKESYSTAERRRRWNKAMSLVSRDIQKYWSDVSACTGCVYLEKAWCRLHDLPCTVNPTMTFRHGMAGMACCGVGKVNRELTLF